MRSQRDKSDADAIRRNEERHESRHKRKARGDGIVQGLVANHGALAGIR